MCIADRAGNLNQTSAQSDHDRKPGSVRIPKIIAVIRGAQSCWYGMIAFAPGCPLNRNGWGELRLLCVWEWFWSHGLNIPGIQGNYRRV